MALVVLLVATLIAAACYAAWQFTDTAKYNVVLVVVDTMRSDALGCYGNPNNPTPRMDALAAEGVRFDTAISTSGWTLPAIGSLVTGAWPTVHGGLGKIVNLTPLRKELPSIAAVLGGYGFNTLGFANAAFVSPMLGFDRGFDVFDHRHAFNQQVRRADETIDAALGAIYGRVTESNFAFIHLFDPHLDYDPPAGWMDKHATFRADPPLPLSLQDCTALCPSGGQAPPDPQDIAFVKDAYEGEINFVDTQIGRLVDELKRMGIYDRTLLIVTADHGEEFWEHGGFEHGHSLYDELIRVPLIIKPPADIPPVERVVKTQVRLVDVAPTVFDMLGIEQPESFVGESLVPLMNGQKETDRIAFSESTLYGADKLAWRGERYKYLFDMNAKAAVREELYDWRNDPGETRNLLAELPDVAARFRAELTAFRDDLTDQARAMSRPVVKDMSPARIRALKSLGYIR